MLAGHEDALEDHLAALPVEASPLAALPQLHFSRLHVIRDLVYQGPPQNPEPLRSATPDLHRQLRRRRSIASCDDVAGGSARRSTRSSPTASATRGAAIAPRSRATSRTTRPTTATSSAPAHAPPCRRARGPARLRGHGGPRSALAHARRRGAAGGVPRADGGRAVSSARVPARATAPAAARGRRRGGTDVDAVDLQGNLLRGYTHPVGAYVFVRVDDAARGREWLRGLLDEVMTAELWQGEAPETTVNLSFTYSGLAALGVSAAAAEHVPGGLPRGHGGARRAARRPSATALPSNWERRPRDGRGARARDALRHRRERSSSAAARGSRTTLGDAVDGRARAALGGAGRRPRPLRLQGRHRPAGDRGQRRRAAPRRRPARTAGGGWRDAARPASSCSATPTRTVACRSRPRRRSTATRPSSSTARCTCTWRGSARTWRQQRQRAPRRPRLCWPPSSSAAGRTARRWSPRRTAPTQAVASDPARVNDFRYGDDPDGLACPIGAHIRRANPRDHEGFFGGKLSNRHRILRRGRAYGPPLAARRARGRRRGPGPDLQVLQRRHRTPVRGDPDRCGSTTATRSASVTTRTRSSAARSTAAGKMVVQGHPPVVLGSCRPSPPCAAASTCSGLGCAPCAGSRRRATRRSARRG